MSMTSYRAAAYRRVIQTLRDMGPAKLHRRAGLPARGRHLALFCTQPAKDRAAQVALAAVAVLATTSSTPSAGRPTARSASSTTSGPAGRGAWRTCRSRPNRCGAPCLAELGVGHDGPDRLLGEVVGDATEQRRATPDRPRVPITTTSTSPPRAGGARSPAAIARLAKPLPRSSKPSARPIAAATRATITRAARSAGPPDTGSRAGNRRRGRRPRCGRPPRARRPSPVSRGRPDRP